MNDIERISQQAYYEQEMFEECSEPAPTEQDYLDNLYGYPDAVEEFYDK